MGTELSHADMNPHPHVWTTIAGVMYPESQEQRYTFLTRRPPTFYEASYKSVSALSIGQSRGTCPQSELNVVGATHSINSNLQNRCKQPIRYKTATSRFFALLPDYYKLDNTTTNGRGKCARTKRRTASVPCEHTCGDIFIRAKNKKWTIK